MLFSKKSRETEIKYDPPGTGLSSRRDGRSGKNDLQ